MGQGWRKVADFAEIDGRECEADVVSVFVSKPSLSRWELERILSVFGFHSS